MSTPPHLTLPACARARQLDTARGPFAVHDATPDGPALGVALLVPGYTGSKEDFITALEPLAAGGYRTVALDQRGQFETPGPEDPAAYALDALAADLLAIAAALGDEPVHLVGHSFGGFAVREAAIADPSRVRSATLLCSGPGPLPEAEATRARMLAELMAELDLPTVWDFVSAMAEANDEYVGVDHAVVDFMRQRFVNSTKAGLLAMGAHLLETPDRCAALAATGVPVLVSYGEDDYIWPLAEQDDMARRCGARLEVIRGAAHSPAVQHPVAFAQIMIDFWATAR